jgi:hypothetical protein
MLSSDNGLAPEAAGTLAVLHARYADDIHKHVRRLLGDGEEAEEVFRAVFVRAREELAQGNRAPASLRAWILAIAHQEAVRKTPDVPEANRPARPRDAPSRPWRARQRLPEGAPQSPEPARAALFGTTTTELSNPPRPAEPSPPQNATTGCPHLRYADDPANRYSRPTRMHRCFASGHPTLVSLDEQKLLCFTAGYGVCARITGPAPVPEPRAESPTESETVVPRVPAPTVDGEPVAREAAAREQATLERAAGEQSVAAADEQTTRPQADVRRAAAEKLVLEQVHHVASPPVETNAAAEMPPSLQNEPAEPNVQPGIEIRSPRVAAAAATESPAATSSTFDLPIERTAQVYVRADERPSEDDATKAAPFAELPGPRWVVSAEQRPHRGVEPHGVAHGKPEPMKREEKRPVLAGPTVGFAAVGFVLTAFGATAFTFSGRMAHGTGKRGRRLAALIAALAAAAFNWWLRAIGQIIRGAGALTRAGLVRGASLVSAVAPRVSDRLRPRTAAPAKERAPIASIASEFDAPILAVAAQPSSPIVTAGPTVIEPEIVLHMPELAVPAAVPLVHAAAAVSGEAIGTAVAGDSDQVLQALLALGQRGVAVTTILRDQGGVRLRGVINGASTTHWYSYDECAKLTARVAAEPPPTSEELEPEPILIERKRPVWPGFALVGVILAAALILMSRALPAEGHELIMVRASVPAYSAEGDVVWTATAGEHYRVVGEEGQWFLAVSEAAGSPRAARVVWFERGPQINVVSDRPEVVQLALTWGRQVRGLVQELLR